MGIVRRVVDAVAERFGWDRWRSVESHVREFERDAREQGWNVERLERRDE